MFTDKAQLRKTKYKKPKKDKHFRCTRCDNKCSHLTTKETLGGINIIPEGEAFCKRCTTYWRKKWMQMITQKLQDNEDNYGN